jgi:hypothetical protein
MTPSLDRAQPESGAETNSTSQPQIRLKPDPTPGSTPDPTPGSTPDPTPGSTPDPTPGSSPQREQDPSGGSIDLPLLPAVVRVLDAATVASFLCAETFASSVGRAMGHRWTISPLYALALALLIARHAKWPSPSLASRLATAAIRAWRDGWTRRIVLVALATRLVVLGVGYAGAVRGGQLLAPANFRLSHNVFWNLPARYDAGWYLGIARNGYEWWPEYADRQQNIVFFPGFPAAMRVAGDLVTLPARLLRDPTLFGNGNTRVVWGGALVAMLAFTLALVRMRDYGTRLGLDTQAAFRGAALLACAPFAYFFSAPYSEGLFLLAAVSTFSAWRRRDLPRAAAWGLLAGFTRSNGWTISAALVVDALAGWREGAGAVARRLAVAAVPIVAAAVFSAYNSTLTGHPLTWMTAQAAWGNRLTPFGFATARWGHVHHIGFRTYLTTDPGDAASVACVVVVLLLCFVMLYRRWWLEATFTLAYLVPGLVLDIPSLGRMTSVLFPAYLALASLLPRSAPGSLRSPGAYGRSSLAWIVAAGSPVWIVAAGSLALQLVFAFRFFGWRPPY